MGLTRLPSEACFIQCRDNSVLLVHGHLVEEWYQNGIILRTLTLSEMIAASFNIPSTTGHLIAEPRLIIIGRLSMDTHNASTSRHTHLQHHLHHLALIAALG